MLSVPFSFYASTKWLLSFALSAAKKICLRWYGFRNNHYAVYRFAFCTGLYLPQELFLVMCRHIVPAFLYPVSIFLLSFPLSFIVRTIFHPTSFLLYGHKSIVSSFSFSSERCMPFRRLNSSSCRGCPSVMRYKPSTLMSWAYLYLSLLSGNIGTMRSMYTISAFCSSVSSSMGKHQNGTISE